MEVGFKVNRRSRTQPFDLRRKVLLKNFLREQMTYIPQTRLVCAIQDLDASFSEEIHNSSEIEKNLEELNDENSSSLSASAVNANSSGSAEENNLESTAINNNTVININDTAKCDVPEPKLFNISSFMRLRSGFKKSKAKSIVKAKKVCKNVKGPFKREFLKSSLRSLSMRNKHLPGSENSSKSLFSLLKSRKAQKKAKVASNAQSTNSVSQTTSSSDTSIMANQSVQTDDSWARQELDRVQESNKLLREENRLLSESLSYFMRSSSIDSQLNYCGSPLQSSNRNMNNLNRSNGHLEIPSSSHDYNNNNDWTPRSKLLRSKSVQEQANRRNTTRYCYRTRSMNYHNIRNNVHHESTSPLPPPPPPPSCLLPRVRRNSVLTSLPLNATSGVVQRRSSMPERTLSENDRLRICRRSGSVRDTRGTPFHALPAEAFY